MPHTLTSFRTSSPWLIAAALALAGCAAAPLPASHNPIEVAFSPDAGSETLVVKVLASAQTSIRLAGYSFTSPAVVRGLIDAHKGGVDVKVLVDDRGNRGQASLTALNFLASAGIQVRVIGSYAIHHDKYIVVDQKHTETGSFNFSQAAARSNSENVLVIWNSPEVAEKYLKHWESRWQQVRDFEGRVFGKIGEKPIAGGMTD